MKCEVKVRETEFIETSSGVFLPRPTSVFGGMARDAWFERLTGNITHIASPEFWNKLCCKHEVFKLIEYDNGHWEIQGVQSSEHR